MEKFIEALDGVQEIAYRLLTWIVFIPKTLWKIVTHPHWVDGYVKSQIGKKDGFNDYFSPIFLVLLTSLIPFVYLVITPTPGVLISGDRNGVVNEPVYLQAQGDFIAANNTYTFDWTAKDEITNTISHAADTYPVDSFPEASDKPVAYAKFVWDSTGWKDIEVTAKNNKGEEYTDYWYVYVDTTAAPAGTTDTTSQETNQPVSNPTEQVTNFLKGPNGILATLIFLGIPMIFALAMVAFGDQPLSAENLKSAFYIQCYYLSPFNLTLWAFIMGSIYFITPDEGTYYLLGFTAIVAILVWLGMTETRVIATARGMPWYYGLGLFVLCLGGLVGGAILTGYFLDNPESFRQTTWWLYGGGIGVLVFYTFGRMVWTNLRRRWRARQNTKQ